MKKLIFLVGLLPIFSNGATLPSTAYDAGQFAVSTSATSASVAQQSGVTNAAGAAITFNLANGAATELQTTNSSNQTITITGLPTLTARDKTWLIRVYSPAGTTTLAFAGTVPTLGDGETFINPPPAGLNTYLLDVINNTLYIHPLRPLTDVNTGSLVVSNSIVLAGTLSPSQITGNQNNYNPTGFINATSGKIAIRSLLLTSDASRTITGIQTDGINGTEIAIWNAGTNPIVFTDDSASSSTTNRFYLPNSDTITLRAKEGLMLRYSTVANRWRTLSKPALFGGDSGVGGFNGLVPAPAAGDAAAGKVLGAAGTWVTSSGIVITNMVTPYVLLDEFLGAVVTSQLGWQSSASGGTFAMATSGLDTNHMGLLQCDTGTTTNGHGNGNLILNGMWFGSGVLIIDWWIDLSNLSDDTENYITRIGLGDSGTGGVHIDGAWFQYNHLENSGNWQCCTASNSVITTNITSVPVTASTTGGAWNKLRIYGDATGANIYFLIGGTNVCTNTTNIPIGFARGCGPNIGITKQGGSTGTTSRKLYADRFQAVWVPGTQP